MRRTFLSIGCITLALLAPGHLCAAVSNSYQMEGNALTNATEQRAAATDYTLVQNGVTWNRQPVVSTSYQIVPVMHAAAVSTSSSSSSIGGTSSSSSSTTHGGHHGHGTTHSSSSLHGAGQSSSSSSLHGAATSSSARSQGTAEQTSAPSTTHSANPAKTNGGTSARARMLIRKLRRIQSHSATPQDLTPAAQTLLRSLKGDGVGAFLRRILDALTSTIGASTILSTSPFLFLWWASKKKRGTKKKKTAKKRKHTHKKHLALILLSVLAANALGIQSAHTAQSVPNEHIYNGRLLDSGGNPVTTAQSIRFSYWKSTDAVTGDITASGAINTGATTYANWNEVHTVTPNTNGYFSVELGSITALPDMSTMPLTTLLGLYLQTEVKPSASANTAYEILDVDPTDTAIDRSGVLSVPFAVNADLLDQHDVGTGSGSIPVLRTNGVLPVSTIPGGTNTSTFTLDSDNTETSEIALTFGTTLAKKLSYDIGASTFRFNDNVAIQGNLTVSGLINGMNLTSIQSSTGALKAFSGGGLNVGVSQGSYRLNGTLVNYLGGTVAAPASATSYVFFGSGGLTARTGSYPTDESFIPVARVITSAGSILSVTDQRALSSDDRELTRALTFNPSYEKASYQGDGADNIGQLSVSHDNITLANFYDWTSTKATLQDYDVILRVPVPNGFVRWKTEGTVNPLTLMYRSTSANAADNKLDIQVYDTNGVPVTLSGSATGLVGTSWNTAQLEFSGSPTWTAGQDMLVRLKVYAKDNYQMHIGGLKLTTVELLGQ